jgi:hypothetical protein
MRIAAREADIESPCCHMIENTSRETGLRGMEVRQCDGARPGHG